MGEVRSYSSKIMLIRAILSQGQRHKENLSCGVKLIWPYLNSFCSYAGSFSVKTFQIGSLNTK